MRDTSPGRYRGNSVEQPERKGRFKFPMCTYAPKPLYGVNSPHSPARILHTLTHRCHSSRADNKRPLFPHLPGIRHPCHHFLSPTRELKRYSKISMKLYRPRIATRLYLSHYERRRSLVVSLQCVHPPFASRSNLVGHDVTDALVLQRRVSLTLFGLFCGSVLMAGFRLVFGTTLYILRTRTVR